MAGLETYIFFFFFFGPFIGQKTQYLGIVLRAKEEKLLLACVVNVYCSIMV